MNVFFLTYVDYTGLGPSAYHFKVDDLAAFVTPFNIHWMSSWFMFLSTVLVFFLVMIVLLAHFLSLSLFP